MIHTPIRNSDPVPNRNCLGLGRSRAKISTDIGIFNDADDWDGEDIMKTHLMAGAFGIMVGFSGTALHAATDLGQFEDGAPILVSLQGNPSSVFVEVDGLDVTEFSYIENGVLIIEPLAGFGNGQHILTVYNAADPNFAILIEAYFETTGGSSLTWQFDATHEAEYREVNGTGDETLTSSGTLAVETDNQSVAASVGYYASNDAFSQINGNTIDITEYLISINHTAANATLASQLGHHSLDFDAALISSYYSRGLSAEYATSDQRFKLGLYGMRVAPDQGAENFTGLADPDDRIQGARLYWQPLYANSFEVSLQAYEGEGLLSGAIDTSTGSGYSISLAGASGDGSFRYGWTSAQTTFDEDGDLAVYEDETGQAHIGYVSYDLPQNGLTSTTIGLSAAFVDDDYLSLGNVGLATGVETYTATIDLARNALSVGFLAETQETNYNGDPTVETDRINFYSLNATYDDLGQGFLSNASLSVLATLYQQERLITPLGAPDPMDREILYFDASIDSYSDVWAWGIGYVFEDYNDLTALNEDTQSHELNGNVNYAPTADLSLGARFQLIETKDIFETWQDRYLDVDATIGLVPGSLDFTAAAGVFDTNQPGYDDGNYIEGSLTWYFVPNAELVFSGRRAQDSYAFESGTDTDNVFSILLRTNTNFLR